MDRNSDIDNFERLLKDRSDEFKMYPTKRVWYSIYNNIHPGRKWPSVAMSITLIAILLIVSYLNTNNKNINLITSASSVQPKQTASASANIFTTSYNPFLEIVSIYNQTPVIPFANNSTSGNLNSDNNTIESLKSSAGGTFIPNANYNYGDSYNITFGNTSVSDRYGLTEIAPIINNELTTAAPTNDDWIVVILNNKIQHFVNEKNTLTKNAGLNFQNKINPGTEENAAVENSTLIALTDLNDATINGIELQNTISVSAKKYSTLKEESNLSNAEKAWIENYALYNRPAPKKWIGKLGWQTYITPSVVFRNLKNTISTEGDINNAVVQHPSVGLEIGRGLIYSLFSGVKLKTGLQLNFTRYNAEAFGNSHPVATTITLHSETGDPYPAYRSTPFSNNDGITPIKLHNETYQISIPIGMDVKLAGNEILQWNFGATIQPSYVIGGKSYLISSDKRNYIKETSLLNRWNLNAGFETFISYKTNGFTLQLGPQFRKQLFTTNTKQYSVQEKLVNYGFKFGITKLIK